MKYIDLYSKDLSSKRWPENFYFNILWTGSVAIVFLYLILLVANFIGFQLVKNRNIKLAEEKQSLVLKEQSFNRMVSDLMRLRGDKKALSDISNTIEGLTKNNIKWSILLKKIGKVMNDNVWIDSFATDVVPGSIFNADIHLSGGGLSLDNLNKFIKNLEHEFGDVKVSLKINKDDKLDFQYYSFSLTFLYKGVKK